MLKSPTPVPPVPPLPVDCSFSLTLKCPCDHWPNSIVVDFGGHLEITEELEAAINKTAELTKNIDIKVPDVPPGSTTPPPTDTLELK